MQKNSIQRRWPPADKRSVSTEQPEYVFVCTGPTCGERGGKELLKSWKSSLVDRRLWAKRKVVPVKCFDQCALGPNVCSFTRFVNGADPRKSEELLDSLFGAPTHE